jgi:membrane protein DedA with SNARE-associated domain
MDLLDWLQALPAPALLGATGLLVVGEAIVGLGFVIPGEAALLIASATVESARDFLTLWTVATVCAVVGNVIGFELGRRSGPPLRDTRLIKRHGAERWDRATSMLRERGTWAVFVGRLIPFVRSFVPAVAGAAGMSYRMFLPAISAGAACSSALPILFSVGVIAGVKNAGSEVLIVGAVLLALTLVAVVWVRRTKAKARLADPDGAPRVMELEQDPDSVV